MLSPVTPSHFLTALVAGVLLAAMAAIFLRLDAAVRRVIVDRRRHRHRSFRRDDE